MAKKSALSAILLAIIVCGLVFAENLQLGLAQVGTQVSGVISMDIAWTKANSPYILSGPVAVNSGITLTVEAGAIVNLNGHYIQANGTLTAKGNSTNKIQFNGGSIFFTLVSNGWNEQTGNGCIIENTILNSTSVLVSSSAKIINNIILGSWPSQGGAITVTANSPLIANNTIYGAIYGGHYQYAVDICGGSPVITQNALIGGINGNSSARFSVITNNFIKGGVIVNGGSPTISNNIITALIQQIYQVNNQSYPIGDNSIVESVSPGIGLTGYNFGPDKLYNAVVTNNVIVGCSTGICWNAGPEARIENNLIVNNTKVGLSLGSNAVVKNNTICGSPVGIEIYNFNNYQNSYSEPWYPPTIAYNNIENNSQYNVQSYCCRDINATYNWWGTNDTQSIHSTIYDKFYNSDLGNFSSIPALDTANVQAYPNSTIASASILSSSLTKATYFSLDSNSTISDLMFNGTDLEISFNVTGTLGTQGYVKATVAKNFMPNSDSIEVLLDGNPINYTITSSQDSWIIDFTYHHSTHQIKIIQTKTPKLTPNTTKTPDSFPTVPALTPSPSTSPLPTLNPSQTPTITLTVTPSYSPTISTLIPSPAISPDSKTMPPLPAELTIALVAAVVIFAVAIVMLLVLKKKRSH